jgi:hypothetical protein
VYVPVLHACGTSVPSEIKPVPLFKQELVSTGLYYELAQAVVEVPPEQVTPPGQGAHTLTPASATFCFVLAQVTCV